MLNSIATSPTYSFRPAERSSASTLSPRTERQSKTDALNSLTHLVSPRLGKHSSTLDFQNVQLKGKVHYLYEAQTKGNGKQTYVIPFPIFRVQNNSVLQGSLIAQIKQPDPQSEPTCQSIAQAIKDNIKVHSRPAFGSLDSNCKTINKIFHHATKEAIQVHVSDLSQDKDGNYHFDFQVTLVFGSDTASHISEIFWTLKLKNTILSEDMLIEKESKDRNAKIDGFQEFNEWERDVCWYKEYDERIHPSINDGEDKELNGQQSEEDAEYEIPPPSPPVTQQNRNHFILSDDSLPSPATTTTSSLTVALPAEGQPNPEVQMSIAQANAIKITEIIPNILTSLQAQTEIDRQQKTQIEQLQQQLVNKEREQQVLKDQLEQELRDAQKEFSTLQAREQKLAAEVTRLQNELAAKSQERTPSPPPNMDGLQEQLIQANDAYKGVRKSYEDKKRQLAIAEKAIEDYKTNLGKANQAVTQLKEMKQKLEEELVREKNKNAILTSKNRNLQAESRNHIKLKAIHNSFQQRSIDDKKQKEEAEANLAGTCKALATSKREEDKLKSQLQSAQQDLKKEQADSFVLKRKLDQVQQQVTEHEKEANHQKRLRTETESKSQELMQALNQQLQDQEKQLRAKEETEAKLRAELEAMRNKWIQLQSLFQNGQH